MGMPCTTSWSLAFESHRLATMRPHRSIKTARCVERKSCNTGQATCYGHRWSVRYPTQETDALRAMGQGRCTAYYATSWPIQEAPTLNWATESKVTVTSL